MVLKKEETSHVTKKQHFVLAAKIKTVLVTKEAQSYMPTNSTMGLNQVLANKLPSDKHSDTDIMCSMYTPQAPDVPTHF